MRDYWIKQTADAPAFPDVVWSRPENKRQAGKLLIIGGQAQSFVAPAQAFAAAVKTGIGVAKVLLPDSTRKLLGNKFTEAEFAASTPSGSFAREALAQWLELAEWANGVLLAGDFGRNSETAVLLESFIDQYSGPLTLTGDSIEYFLSSDSPLIQRDKTLAVLDVAQLQKLSLTDVESKSVLQRMSLADLVEVLHDLTSKNPGGLITFHSDQVIVAIKGKVSSTPSSPQANLLDLAAAASVWWLQQPSKPFKAISTAIWHNQFG